MEAMVMEYCTSRVRWKPIHK